jgi:hypothetical protein
MESSNLKRKYIIRVYIPTNYYFISKNIGYAREYPGTMLGPPMVARCRQSRARMPLLGRGTSAAATTKPAEDTSAATEPSTGC